MDKKDIYEHLAKIYLDNPVRKKKIKTKAKDHKNFIIIAIAIGLGLVLLIPVRLYLYKPLQKQVALVFSNDPFKIDLNFDPAKKEVFAINLNNSNLTRFNTLCFSAKKSNYDDTISLRVEYSNSFREKSEVYIKDIPNNWKFYEIKFSDFKAISDWSRMKDLSFIVEEWNTKERKGSVYIDNVKIFK